MNPSMMASRMAARISANGQTVTLANGNTAPALYVNDPKEFQKLVTIDGDMPGRSKVVCNFVFAGTLYGTVNGGDILTYNGRRYTVDSPVWPVFDQDVCIQLIVSCFMA